MLERRVEREEEAAWCKPGGYIGLPRIEQA